MDASFISKADYKYQIRTERLDQILEATDEDEDLMLDSAETEAVAMLRKHLAARYDMNVELSKTGTDRHMVLLRWAKVLVIYYIYERIPDEMVPERVVNNYEEVMDMMARVEAGKADVPDLAPAKVTTEEGETVDYTRRRWGSVPSRANDGANMKDKRW